MNLMLAHAVFVEKRGAEQAVNRSSSESWNATGKCRIQEAATERDLGSGSPGQHHPLGRLERLQWAGGHGLQKAVVVIFEVIG